MNEAGDEGGTLDAGERALKLKMPVLALGYVDPPTCAAGNRRLIGQGAQPIAVTPLPKLPTISGENRHTDPPIHNKLRLLL